jgi:hypothetical protein
MNRLALTSILLVAIIDCSYGQKIYTTEQDIYNIKELTFYGYDFSDWRLAEEKRVGEDMRMYITAWIDMMKERMISEKLSNWYMKAKATPNFTPTTELAKKINPENLVVTKKHYIHTDSVQSFINKYVLTETEGIGLVMIVECFDKNTNRTSGYFTFFDIATKKVLLTEYMDQKEADGYGVKNFWGISLNGITSNHAGNYRKKMNALSGKKKLFPW